MLEADDHILILDYLEGDLDAKALAAFQERLAQDEPLRLLVEQLASDREMLRAVPAQEAPADLMARVQTQLDQQMLADVAPARFAQTSEQAARATHSPVLHRIHHWRPWAGGLAAALALALGLTWYLDPFKPAVPPLDVAIHPRTNTGTPETSHSDADGMAGRYRDNRVSPDALAQDAAGASLAPADDDAPLPTGKAEAALALAALSKGLDPVPGIAHDGDRHAAPAAPTLPGPGNQVAFADPANAAGTAQFAAGPAFQIEMQTASAANTRQVLLNWAHANDARQADTVQRQLALGAQMAALEEEKLADESLAQKRTASPGETSPAQTSHAPSSPAPIVRASPPSTAAKAQTRPADADVAQAPAAIRAEPPKPDSAKKQIPAPATVADADAKAPTIGDAAPAPARFEPAAGPAASTIASDSALVREEITLLVPADRINSLVEHLEAKTGQSFIVVRDGGQTLLLSPQIANERANQRANAKRGAAFEQAAVAKDAAVAGEQAKEYAQGEKREDDKTRSRGTNPEAPGGAAARGQGVAPSVGTPAPTRTAPTPPPAPAPASPSPVAPALPTEPAATEQPGAPAPVTRIAPEAKTQEKPVEQVMIKIVIVEKAK